MDIKIKRLLSIVLTVFIFVTCCGSVSGEVKASGGSSAAGKPAQITMMVDGTLVDAENGQAEFEAKWEALTGIDLVINQPGHDVYYDEVKNVFESKNLPDVVLLSSAYYTQYSYDKMLADISPYYAGSTLEAKIKAEGKSALIDAIKINGKLYGMTPTRGNGCVTYIKKAWLDAVGLGVPTNYDEYINMLKAFTEGDPDENGKKGDTYGVSAAGIISGEAPYTNYLPEFYQDAYPSFYQKDDGTWADGFMDEAMKGALQRLRDAYANGYIDPDIAENGTGDCRDKFYANKFGVFTYWAGTWAKTLSDKLVDAGVDGEIVAIAPLAETGSYLERVAPVWCITSACKNPEGVYKYFIETMMDGGEVEELWTYKPNNDKYAKNHIDHMLAIVPLENDPGASSISEKQAKAMELFDNNSVMADLPYSTQAYSLYYEDLMKLKKELIKKVVVDGMDIETAYSEFEKNNGAFMSDAIVVSLNAE
ncbi:extracellular solute-binding protein [Butyrivibrio sp. YAB3001]|uniref:extracellular solute-binding protein n=1 Tax=Butyrivibrio sp. YAB3001 TaxID=1520812 RepID=UPI0008F66354|nr:extracellular solute-binding protein [Butyrivibrio sp. YAB3001]SFD06569.1 putative aldouronate transport system substrate-binding protein [Butyrivibrio sp. YAB3001]